MSGKKKGSLKYGEARRRLEEILKEVEGNEVDVDDLADRVKEAAGLIRLLREKLEKTRMEVEKVVGELEPEEDVEGEPGTGEDKEDVGSDPDFEDTSPF